MKKKNKREYLWDAGAGEEEEGDHWGGKEMCPGTFSQSIFVPYLQEEE